MPLHKGQRQIVSADVNCSDGGRVPSKIKIQRELQWQALVFELTKSHIVTSSGCQKVLLYQPRPLSTTQDGKLSVWSANIYGSAKSAHTTAYEYQQGFSPIPEFLGRPCPALIGGATSRVDCSHHGESSRKASRKRALRLHRGRPTIRTFDK